MNRLSSKAGFSLIEVMVAMVILAVALTGLTRGLATALKSSKEAEWQAAAAFLAAGQIELLRTEDTYVDGVTEGQGIGGLAAYRWKQTVTATPIQGLHEVAVEVRHSAVNQPLYELRTLLFEVPFGSVTNRPTDGRSSKRNRPTRRNRT